jgi:5-hydroxyisourate hydrolase
MGSPLTTHVLDTRLGQPAAGVAVCLEQRASAGDWLLLARKFTNDDGRISDLLREGELAAAIYRLRFDTGAYFAAQGVEHFYPEIAVEFEVTDLARHHHVPLLLSPFGYSTYRGS